MQYMYTSEMKVSPADGIYENNEHSVKIQARERLSRLGEKRASRSWWRADSGASARILLP